MIKVVKVSDLDSFLYVIVKDDIKKDIPIIVDTDKGLIYTYTLSNTKEYDEKDTSSAFAKFVRFANEDDKKTNDSNVKLSSKAKNDVIKFQKELNLNMRVLDCRFSFDKKQLLITFTSDGRVDFRELAKRLSVIYKTRIEIRQIGVRDKAKLVGGIGPCGRFLCCSTFLNDFNSVSINMAKNQYLALNPTKINGVCGRLLCCLKYEDDQYTDMKKSLPRIGERITIDGVSGKISSVNIFLNTAVIDTGNKVSVEVSLKDYNGSSK